MLETFIKAAVIAAVIILASDVADNIGNGYGLSSLADAIIKPAS